MTQDTFNILTITISCCALGISIISGFVALSRWILDIRNARKSQRLELLRDLFNGFSDHNWNFVQYWSFPGIYPPLKELEDVIPNKEPENQKAFGERVVVLEHLNILLKVFSHQRLLEDEDILGFTNWALSWYEKSKESLKVVLQTGDTYPLDFIIWLRDNVFKNKEFPKLIGDTLQARLNEYEKTSEFMRFVRRLRKSILG
jgi:hypothetical protein